MHLLLSNSYVLTRRFVSTRSINQTLYSNSVLKLCTLCLKKTWPSKAVHNRELTCKEEWYASDYWQSGTDASSDSQGPDKAGHAPCSFFFGFWVIHWFAIHHRLRGWISIPRGRGCITLGRSLRVLGRLLLHVRWLQQVLVTRNPLIIDSE